MSLYLFFQSYCLFKRQICIRMDAALFHHNQFFIIKSRDGRTFSCWVSLSDLRYEEKKMACSQLHGDDSALHYRTAARVYNRFHAYKAPEVWCPSAAAATHGPNNSSTKYLCFWESEPGKRRTAATSSKQHA